MLGEPCDGVGLALTQNRRTISSEDEANGLCLFYQLHEVQVTARSNMLTVTAA